MAQSIASIASSSIPRVSKEQFLAKCLPGMAIFCEGDYSVSRAIEEFTGSPFSHVATVIHFPSIQRWGVLEATKDHGVHVGHLDYYLDLYRGNLVLAGVPGFQLGDSTKLQQAQFDLIDDAYDVDQELSMVAHKLCALYPIKVSKNEYFCSGLYEQGRKVTSLPLKFSGPGMASPQQVWTDPSIVPICALVKS